MDTKITNSSWGTVEQIHFSWYDYTLFAFMLGSSVAIGIYFGCFGKKQNTANEYLLAGKNMKVVPIAISLIASHVSGITILSIPADIYKFGATYAVNFVAIQLTCLIAAYVTVPIFYELQITSTYEYLQLRFDTKTRLMASFLFNLSMIMYLPIVIYGPALALAQATPINLHLVNPIMCAICIFYTTIGGLKTVVWTDTLQFGAMVAAVFGVLFVGISTVGGFGIIFTRSLEGGRLDIDFDIDPTKRDTFWAIVIGWFIGWIPHVAISQGSVQKCLALPTLQDIRKTLLLFAIGSTLAKGTGVLTGLMIYANYYNCDPFTTKRIVKNDQLLPYYIMDTANKIPGLPGLFVAGVFCAALSTLSAQMNSLSGTIYEDFVSRFVPKTITDVQVSNILKAIVVVIGVISTTLVLVVEHLGGILPLTIAFSGVTSGPLLGLFLMGMIFPFVNAKGALYGSISSLLFSAIMLIGNQIYKAKGMLQYQPKPSSTDGCVWNYTSTLNYTNTNLEEDIFPLFKITHYYYTLVGTVVALVIGLSISWFTREDYTVDERLITPWMRWAIPKVKPVYRDTIRYDAVAINDVLEKI